MLRDRQQVKDPLRDRLLLGSEHPQHRVIGVLPVMVDRFFRGQGSGHELFLGRIPLPFHILYLLGVFRMPRPELPQSECLSHMFVRVSIRKYKTLRPKLPDDNIVPKSRSLILVEGKGRSYDGGHLCGLDEKDLVNDDPSLYR
jgi:hypothetical protein